MNTGALTYVGTGEDYESTTAGFDLTVRATDAGGLSADAAVAVTVTNVNETPAFVDASYEFTIDGDDLPAVDPLNGSFAVGSVSANDPDGDTLTYSIEAGDATDEFSIDGTGAITFAGSQGDYPNDPDTVTLTVRATDSAGSYAEVEVTVVVDYDDTPPPVSGSPADGEVLGYTEYAEAAPAFVDELPREHSGAAWAPRCTPPCRRPG